MVFNDYGADSSAYPMVVSGDTGSFVAELQTRLNAAGTNVGGDKAGTFSTGTLQAVINFQNGYSLSSDGPGVVAAETWAKLLEVTPTIPPTGGLPGAVASKAAIPGSPAAQAASQTPLLIVGGAGALFLGLVAIVLHKGKRAVNAARRQ
jgi:peptidoglycan hydrolase-like protein with peptidoglycan-binding domain